MKYKVKHTTTYRYSNPASLSQNELFLQPRLTSSQAVEQSILTIDPEPQYIRHHVDYFSNNCHVFMVQHPHSELKIKSEFVVETFETSHPDPGGTIGWEDAVSRLRMSNTTEELDAYQYCFASPMVELIYGAADYARSSLTPNRPILEASLDLIARIFRDFTYDKKATSVDTSVVQVLEKRKGVCQDFAHLAICALRSHGLAARYVSGYLETLPPPGKPKLVGSDASHAWLSIFIPDVGWVDLDPTNNMIPAEQHVTLAWGRDYGDITPVKGVVMGGGAHKLDVAVDMTSLS